MISNRWVVGFQWDGGLVPSSQSSHRSSSSNQFIRKPPSRLVVYGQSELIRRKIGPKVIPPSIGPPTLRMSIRISVMSHGTGLLDRARARHVPLTLETSPRLNQVSRAEPL